MTRLGPRHAKPHPTVNEQRLAQTMAHTYEGGSAPRREGESDREYFLRLRRLAERVQHEQRKAKRTAARAARKRNR